MNIVAFVSYSLLSITLLSPATSTNPIADRIKGGVLGGLIGDAHGKPTEFIKVVPDIFQKFPGGIITFNDLKKFGLVERNFITGKTFARYTDDTAMARITMEILLESREKDWSIDDTMGKLASAYIKDMQSPTGWTMPGRAPGTTCKKAATKLKERIEWHQTHRVSLHPNWWQAGEITDGGCGSVMRAHPFGLVFADNPKKAATWAAEHSRITHGHPAAIAACAAMAIGTAYAVQGKDPEYIIEQMIAIAKQFDPVEFRDNPYTCQEEKSCWGKMEDAVKLAQAFVPGGVIPLIPFDHPAEQSIYSQKIKIFHTYLGWAADDALAAALYIFALCPDNVTDAIYLGVHTPGDSDSIASMAGALVGARVGAFELQKKHNPENYEDADILVEYAEHATRLIKQIK